MNDSELESVFKAANESLSRAISLADCEHEFVRLADLLEKHPELHETADRRLTTALETADLGLELIEFCAHVFRFPKLRERAVALLAAASTKGDMTLSSLVAAFRDDWPDRALYAYFR